MANHAKARVKYRFKAATGFGAVIEGTVEGTDAESVSCELVRQGLIPTSIWGMESSSSSFLGRMIASLRGIGRPRNPSSAGTTGS